jgi:hypothetical protein
MTNQSREKLAVNKTSTVGAAAVLLALAWAQPSMAQGNCGNIQFTGDITNRFPQARNACLDVVTREGQQYAHFQARVARVQGNTVEAEFKLPDGTYSRPISVTPAADARVRIQGRTYRYRDLSRGQELDLYVPPDRWEIAVPNDPEVEFVAATTVTTFAIAQPAPSLPRTASPLPLLGALGGLLTALGFLVTMVRRRFS